MIYNRTFIAAVHAVASTEGEDAAREVFNKLFGVAPVAAPETPEQAVSRLSNGNVTPYDVYRTNLTHGPLSGRSSIPWIKELRDRTHCGLKEAKDVHDYVRDNPGIDWASY